MPDPYAPPKVDIQLTTTRLPWLKLGILLVALVAGQTGILGSVVVVAMLCVAGGSVDAHLTGGDEYVQNICSPGVISVVFVGAVSVALWAVGYFIARRVVRRHKERQRATAIENASIR